MTPFQLAAILVHIKCKHARPVIVKKMVLCAIFGCGTRSVRDKGIYMARLPTAVTNQGEEILKLSEERQKKWISAISRKDLNRQHFGSWPCLW